MIKTEGDYVTDRKVIESRLDAHERELNEHRKVIGELKTTVVRIDANTQLLVKQLVDRKKNNNA